MDSRDTSTRILAIAGAALVWLALLAPLASPVWVLVQRAFFTLGLAGGGDLGATGHIPPSAWESPQRPLLWAER
jgi:hypothetical protein